MKNTFGQNIAITLFGESHGEYIGAVIDGLCPGIEISEDFIARQLSRRRPSSAIDTSRREADNFKIISGVFNGKATGTPLAIIIPNENTISKDYNYGLARPSHADYAAFCKYHGYEDYRGGGHFSGRITAALVAAGAILISALDGLNIRIGTHIKECAGINDRNFGGLDEDILFLQNAPFPTLDKDAGRKISEKIAEIKEEKDSIGGIIQTAVTNLPAGLGEPWFDSVESILSHALFSIGGIKGVQFGLGFDGINLKGSEYNDSFFYNNAGVVKTATNNNGGINGGITNGMPVLFSCAVKPTPSIARQQDTIDFINGQNTEMTVHGRHDPAIIRRICPVVDSVTAICVCDMLAGRYGTDIFMKGIE